MPSTTIEARDLSVRFSELIAQTAPGTEIIVTENNVPMAKLVTMSPQKLPRVPGLHRGAYVIADDFDEPLPEEFWLGESP